jgi:hypothetical protein
MMDSGALIGALSRAVGAEPMGTFPALRGPFDKAKGKATPERIRASDTYQQSGKLLRLLMQTKASS